MIAPALGGAGSSGVTEATSGGIDRRMRPRPSLRTVAVAAVALALALSPTVASGHAERETVFPSGRGHVPRYRTTGPELVVCKPDSARRIAGFSPALKARNEALLTACRFHDIQDAVDHVTRAGTRIEVLPGMYMEKPT